jgi:uncharacterized membrane protein
MSIVIEPFKCQDVLVKLGSSCEKQEEIYNNLKNLQTGVTTLAPNSVAVGSGLGDSAWNEALNYEEKQKEITEQKAKEVEKKSIEVIEDIKLINKKRDFYIYGGVAILVLGVIIYELKSKK